MPRYECHCKPRCESLSECHAPQRAAIYCDGCGDVEVPGLGILCAECADVMGKCRECGRDTDEDGRCIECPPDYPYDTMEEYRGER